MRRTLTSLSLVIFLGVLSAQAQQGLTNADIIKMQSAGLSESVILSSVNSQPAAYDTSADGLVALKKAGVSDAIVSAMITRNAAMKSGVATATGTTPPAAAPPPGVDDVGVYYQGSDKTWHAIPAEVVNTKSGGVMKRLATDGIVKGDVNGHVEGASSATKLTTANNILIRMAEGFEPTDYVLVKLHKNSNNREFRTQTGGVFHSSAGATKDMVAFTSQKLAPHVYQLSFTSPLGPGEYGIVPPGSINTANMAAGGKIYTFSISE